MAISRTKKQTLVADLKALLDTSKMTVYAAYNGLSVADLEDLRHLARETGVQIKIVKNRLVKVAMDEIAIYQNTDKSALTGQLLYATSATDEVAPAQILDKFAQTHDMLAIKGAISREGNNLSEAEVKSLAKLPSRDQLIAEIIATLTSPLHDTTNALSGNLHALLDGISAKATN
jgi:large subunit ribosomal protein L10